MPTHQLTNFEIMERQQQRHAKATARHQAATEANPYLQRTNDRLAELRAAAFEQAYGRQLRSTGFQQQ